MSNYAICPVTPQGTLIGGAVIDQDAAVVETANWQEVSLSFTNKGASGEIISVALVCQPDVNVWVAIKAEAIAGADPVQGIRVPSGETVPFGILPGQRVFVRTV